MAEEIQTGKAGLNKKLLIIIVAALVLLLSIGSMAYLLLGSDSSPERTTFASAEPKRMTNPISYVNIAQPFIFNVTGQSRDRVVQIKVQLMVRGSENEELARHHSPLVESTLLSTFASMSVEQLRSANGRVELREQATSDIQVSLSKVVGRPVVEKVLFTDFVIQ